METEIKQKIKLFKQIFFSSSSKIDFSDIKGYRYLGLVVLLLIIEVEVRSAILGMLGKKALGKDRILSYLLHNLLLYLLPLLHQLYNACLNLYYCLKHFRESITVTDLLFGNDAAQHAGSYPIGPTRN
jgi:hypothetical protein